MAHGGAGSMDTNQWNCLFMKRVLIYSDWFAPGYRAGGPIQSLVNLTLTVEHAMFYIVTSDTDHHAVSPYTDIVPNQWLKFREHIHVIYLSMDEITRSRFEQIAMEIQADMIYLNSMFSPRFTVIPLRMTKPKGVQVMVAPRGMLKQAALAQKGLKKKLFLFLAKRMGWYKNVIWHATNEAEKREIQRHFGNATDIRIADNLSASPQSQAPTRIKSANQVRLCCVARISPEKGIMEALQYLVGMDWQGALHLDFYGAQQDPVFLQTCMDILPLIKGATIRFMGEKTPQQLDQIWNQYDMLYMPTRGENFGHAIAESLNHGLPVIISDQTPWRQLQEKGIGWDLELRPDLFQSVIKACIELTSEEYSRMSWKAWTYAVERYQRDETRQHVQQLFGMQA
jgi:glycosyltransferase involved in cell wall biosynthesis